ncbi:MAG TPA: transglutaminase domain-containing protein [Gemmatales bacterium]|nr:transglutaminase domain-containing protein [Gemmatales bacterium]HMP58247.1 transglutaminase domain-containing protein [Gemmatales bacterium]
MRHITAIGWTGAFGLLLALGAGATVPVRSGPYYVIETRDRSRVSALLTFDVQCPDFTASEWRAFAAIAPELPSQFNVRTSLDPPGVPVRERGPLGRRLLMARVPVVERQLRSVLPLQATYEATLRARTLRRVEEPPPGPRARLTVAERAQFLAERGDFDWKQERFRSWLKQEGLERQPDEVDVDFARRVFLHLRGRASYDFQEEMDRRASVVCQDGKSDCGGLSTLYVSVLRAGRVPARTLYGRWAMSATEGEKINETPYYQWHVKSEFFAEGVGWVPVDLAAGIVFDRTPNGLLFFGFDSGEFITFHLDSNWAIETELFGVKTMHNLQGLAWWARGQGNVKSATIKEGWTVKTLPTP